MSTPSADFDLVSPSDLCSGKGQKSSKLMKNAKDSLKNGQNLLINGIRMEDLFNMHKKHDSEEL